MSLPGGWDEFILLCGLFIWYDIVKNLNVLTFSEMEIMICFLKVQGFGALNSKFGCNGSNMRLRFQIQLLVKSTSHTLTFHFVPALIAKDGAFYRLCTLHQCK